MAWARIHDSALNSPKLIKLFKATDPLHVWVWGLTYCQLHLTDGAIPREALPHGGTKAAETLIERRLWEASDDGYQIHDYLDWNDSKKTISDKRVKARERVTRFRAGVTPRVTDQENSDVRGDANVGRGVASISRSDLLKKEDREPNARSGRPVFSGQRVTVFEWMLDDISKTLGEHFEPFDVHRWLYDIDAAAVSKGLVIPKRDGGEWLQSQLLTECQRRGIPLKMAGKEDPQQAHADLTKRVAAKLGITLAAS